MNETPSTTGTTAAEPQARTAARPTRIRRMASSMALALMVLTVAAGCSVQDMRAWFADHGVDTSQMSDQEVQPYADASTVFWNNWFAEQARLSRFNHVLTDSQLYRLRMCESGDNYGAVSHGGSYRGAYQFSFTTWNGVAAQHFPEYVGLDPAAASPAVQDAMTRALWSTNGPRPWPVCGYRV